VIERDDWEGPPDTPAPQSISSPVKEIARPNWDGTEPPAQAERTDDGRIARNDWPLVPDVAEEAPVNMIAEEAPVVDTPPLAESMISELAETGEHDLEIAHMYVQATLDAVPIADRAGFVAGFDGLPPGAQKAIIGELAIPGKEYEGLAGEDELEKFASTPEGAELVALWDDDADINLARVQARLSRIEANTSPAAIEVMWDWFDELPSSQAKAVFQTLAE